MHEQRIVEKILKEAEKQGARKAISVQVGELAEISADELMSALKEHSRLNVKIDQQKSRIECACGYKGSARIIEREHDFCIFDCPRCSNKRPPVVAGGEIKLVGVE